MKIFLIILAVVILLGGLPLAFKLIGGAISIVGGALNTILGIVLIIGLVFIVIWMFKYAGRH